MPKTKTKTVKVVRSGGKVKRVRIRNKAKQAAAPRVNQIDVAGKSAPARRGPSPSLVVVEDTTIRMMMADPRFLQAIPCLQASKTKLANAAKTCGRCSRKKAGQRKRAMNGVRQCMVSLPTGQRALVKKMLGAKQVRIVLKGQHVTY